MATTPTDSMNLNPEYDPSEKDADAELVLNVMKTDPFPVVSPQRVVARTPDDFDKYDAHHALNDLANAGWVHKRALGLYDLVMDPRGHVPTWPVAWEDADDLPGPQPAAPEDIERVQMVHERFARRDD